MQFGDGLAHRGKQVLVSGEMMMNTVRDDLGVGLRGELIAQPREILTQLLVILDDAVVDDRDAVARDVRVRIALVRHAMGCPARVGDAEMTGGRCGGQRLGELRDLADGTQPRDRGAAIQHRDAGRVVAAIFEALQALDQDRDDVTSGDRSDDSAHALKILGAPGGAVATF